MNHKIGLGGGCHWCTEAVFQSLKGVVRVEQGWIASVPPFDTFSEAVIVTFDPGKLSLNDLILIHLLTHQSTSNHSFREKYRSAIYYFNPDEKQQICQIVKDHQTHFEKKIITKALPFKSFKPSDQQYQNYYFKNPDKPFCERFIHPKLDFLREQYSLLVEE